MDEIETLGDLDAALSSGTPLTGLRIQDLDLTGHEDELLARTDLEGLVVLGGNLSPALDAHLRLHGVLVFPDVTRVLIRGNDVWKNAGDSFQCVGPDNEPGTNVSSDITVERNAFGRQVDSFITPLEVSAFEGAYCRVSWPLVRSRSMPFRL